MNRLNRRTDAELLELTAADPQAFATFYRRHERLVIAFLMSRGCNPELAIDLAAEVFASILEAPDRFDPERAGGSSAVAWILAISRNKLLASIRKGVVAEEARRRLQCEPLVLEAESLDRLAGLSAANPNLNRLLEELPADQRDSVTARVLEDRQYKEIAEELRCSELVVRKRVSRGLLRLRAALTMSAEGAA